LSGIAVNRMPKRIRSLYGLRSNLSQKPTTTRIFSDLRER